eukprot:TRINITY_DN8779_c0_g1_i1.p1 TRINITY_DN8779_c0_g1~~TRINITY_DN8779_c0_g1_i1.p1  ORF type:complete len:348 (+),score=83.72 TRINITY_DN8779_c0_g1_i1:104-1045(+)
MVRRCPDNWLYCSGYCLKHEGMVEEIKVFAAEETKFYNPNEETNEKSRIFVLPCTNMDDVNRGLNILGMISRNCGVDKKLWKEKSSSSSNHSHIKTINPPIPKKVTTPKPPGAFTMSKNKGKKKKKVTGPPLNVDRNKMKSIAKGIQLGDEEEDEEDEDEPRIDRNQQIDGVLISSFLSSRHPSREVWQEYDERYFMDERKKNWEDDWESEEEEDFFPTTHQTENETQSDDDLKTALAISLLEENSGYDYHSENEGDQGLFSPFNSLREPKESPTRVCPVGCGKVFSFHDSESFLNQHIDECLNRVYLEENTV